MLRIGIVGTGLIAAEHAKAIARLPDVARLVAAADVVPERLKAFCDSFNVPVAQPTANALIALPEVDLVAVTTPPAAHRATVLAALDAGKYVFCEKPLAHTLADALAIVEADQRRPHRIAVGYQLRYEPAYRRLVWLCRNGWIGDIESIRIERHSHIPHANAGNAGWWGAWDVSGGGVLITQLIHELDLLIQVAGQPLAVAARMDTRYTGIESEDYAELTLRLAGGGTARCIASVDSPQRGGGITIVGTRGEIGLPWRFVTKDPAAEMRALAALDRALPETRGPSTSFAARGARFAARKAGLPPAEPLSAHALLYRDIAAAIAAGKPLPIPPSAALESLELVAAAYESAVSGEEVRLPLERTGAALRGVTRERFAARRCKRFAPKPVPVLARSPHTIRVGFVGVDTSHAPTFAGILHDPSHPFHIPGAKVVAAFPGGSPDMPISSSRVGGFTAELRDRHRVRIVAAPEDAADLADVVFILSSDGRVHPALFNAVAGRGKPVFIDKPFAVSTADADAMLRTADASGTTFLACSAFRYADGLVDALASVRAGGERVTGCTIRFWLQIQPTQGRYFWYGIHAAEMLVAALGPGIADVEATGDERGDSIVVRHDNGVESTLVGSRTDGDFSITLTTDRRTIDVPLGPSAAALPSRVLWSALDVLVGDRYPRLWSGSSAGSVTGPRQGRSVDPTPEETRAIVRLLDAAQKSQATGQRVAVAA